MALSAHPTRSAIEAFFLEVCGPVDTQVVPHLLEECPTCVEVAASLWSHHGQVDQSAGVKKGGTVGDCRFSAPCEANKHGDGSAIRRTSSRASDLEERLAMERAAARVSFPVLLEQPPERRRMLIDNTRRYRSWAICEELMEAAFAQGHHEPAVARELAELAVELAASLDPRRYSPPCLLDLQGRSWAFLSNARRICGDYLGAEDALTRARLLLARGSGDPIEEALVSDVETSLHSARRQYDRALRAIGRSIEIYRRLGENHLLGRALIQKGMVCVYAGDSDAAVVLLRSGLALADPDRDPRVVLAAWHNVSLALHAAGHHRPALRELATARPLYLQHGGRTALLRFQWLEGTIAAALGRHEQAEGCLRETREGFLQLGIAHDAAIVSLDLAGLLARQGRNAEVCHLAAEMIAIFESRESKTEALAALILLRQAAEREHVTEALVQRLRASLQDARAEG